MILQTPILALLLVSAIAAVVAVWAAGFGVRVLRHWNLADGGRAQLEMERTTELVSTLFRFVMVMEIAALFFFVFNADRMAALFVGAMCAVGTFNANAYGFPALYLKIAVFFAAALWMILDHIDRGAPDYPLTRAKSLAVVVIAPLIVANAGTELAYFLNLETDVITSCCSKLFTPANEGIAAEMTGLAPDVALMLLGASATLVAGSGAVSVWAGRGQGLFAVAGALFFGAALTAIVSVISLYIYDHPNHHCPFCVLKPEYGYVGYALYVPLFFGTALALGAGMVGLLATAPSLAARREVVLRRLVIGALAAFGIFLLVVVGAITTSQLILFG